MVSATGNFFFVVSELIRYEAVGIFAIVIRHANRIISAPQNIGCAVFLHTSQVARKKLLNVKRVL
jgi:predicted urease superfamily metal-dependent hydrolase